MPRKQKQPKTVPGATLPIAPGAKRQFFVETMALYYEATKHTDIRARTVDRKAPEIIKGTEEDHRPDITCVQPDSRGTGIILLVIMPEDLVDGRLESRVDLMVSAAQVYRAQIQFAVPNAICAHNRRSAKETLRSRLDQFGYKNLMVKIWEI